MDIRIHTVGPGAECNKCTCVDIRIHTVGPGAECNKCTCVDTCIQYLQNVMKTLCKWTQ